MSKLDSWNGREHLLDSGISEASPIICDQRELSYCRQRKD